jgi:hypothetical protein
VEKVEKEISQLSIRSETQVTVQSDHNTKLFFDVLLTFSDGGTLIIITINKEKRYVLQ